MALEFIDAPEFGERGRKSFVPPDAVVKALRTAADKANGKPVTTTTDSLIAECGDGAPKSASGIANAIGSAMGDGYKVSARKAKGQPKGENPRYVQVTRKS